MKNYEMRMKRGGGKEAKNAAEKKEKYTIKSQRKNNKRKTIIEKR